MGKHLDFDARLEIEKGLKAGESFSEIAETIGRNKTTVYREVIGRRKYVNHREITTIQTKNACVYRYKCDIKELCKSPTCFKRNKNCRLCGNCNGFCSKFEEEVCPKHALPPFVCNGCEKKPRCSLSKWVYEAKVAEAAYKKTLSSSREGISLAEEELERLNEIVSPLIKKGQSVRFICSHKSNELNVSDKTIYKYISGGLLDADKFDLKRTLQRKERKKAGPPVMVDRKCRSGRLYSDYTALITEKPDTAVVEMDTVEGVRGGKVMLTLLFRNCNLQIAFLRDANDSLSVTNAFIGLRSVLTADEFSSLFPVILTDRGSEFSSPLEIETDLETGEIQSELFYCDPQNSSQKAFCERNHEFIRYVIPKGDSLNELTQADMVLMMNHINSYGREKFNFKSPLEIFTSIYGPEIVKKLGLKLIPPEEINLTPELLKKKN